MDGTVLMRRKHNSDHIVGVVPVDTNRASQWADRRVNKPHCEHIKSAVHVKCLMTDHGRI